jgi:hypothetical protein
VTRAELGAIIRWELSGVVTGGIADPADRYLDGAADDIMLAVDEYTSGVLAHGLSEAILGPPGGAS